MGRQADGSHPFLAPGAAALGVQAASFGGPLAPAGRGPTGFTAALDASILNVPLFQGCTMITVTLMVGCDEKQQKMQVVAQ